METSFMKDFYYILGIPQTASAEDVKKAYRKLVQKFHPDKNDGDLFFAERFQEIQEAYDTLSVPARRTIYDAERKKTFSAETSHRTNTTAPVIEYFKTDKTAFAHGDTVTFYWKTFGANRVSIKPFGQVPASGEKTYRLKDFKNPSLSFELLAERTGSGKHAKATLTLHNTTYQELYEFFKRKIQVEGGRGVSSSKQRTYSRSGHWTATKQGRNELLYTSMRPVFVIVALIVVILFVLFFVVL